MGKNIGTCPDIPAHIALMRWPVGFHDDFMPEFRSLHRDVQDEIYAVARLL